MAQNRGYCRCVAQRQQNRAMRSHIDMVRSFLPDLAIARNEINRLRFENNGLSVKHENAMRSLQSSELEIKKLKAQLDVAMSAARKTEAFNSDNRNSFVLQKVQIEALQKERDNLKQDIVNFQLANAELKSQLQNLLDQLRIHEKKRQRDVTIDQLKAEALKAAEILEKEKVKLMKWICLVRERVKKMFEDTSTARRILHDARDRPFMDKTEVLARQEHLLDEGPSISFECETCEKRLMEMQIKLTDAVNRSNSYKKALSQAVHLMNQSIEKRNEQQQRALRLEEEHKDLKPALKEGGAAEEPDKSGKEGEDPVSKN